MSLFNDASLITTPNGVKAGKLFSVKPFDGSGDFTWVRNTNATRVNENGLIETVGANVPRLDYSNGGCPCILVEPQRTNLLLRSEEFENSYWGKTRITTTANSIISPDGNTTADLNTANGSGAGGVVVASGGGAVSVVSATRYNISVFVKKGNLDWIVFNIGNSAGTDFSRQWFNINTGLLGGSSIAGVGLNALDAKTEYYGNGWFRCSFNVLTNDTGLRCNYILTNANLAFSVTINDFFYTWGAQLEVGSNATSYIPTVASAVTRNSDVGTFNTTGLGITEITETFETGAPNVITTIPSTYQLPNGRIKTIVGL